MREFPATELVQIDLGPLTLGFRPDDVVTFIGLAEVQQLGQGAAVGVVRYAEDHWPVYSLDRELRPLAQIPKDHTLCLLLHSGRGYLGMTAVTQVTGPVTSQILAFPLAGCMHTAFNPVRELAWVEDRMICLCTGEDLTSYLVSVQATTI